jgi:DNA-binding response OmpR family regulator
VTSVSLTTVLVVDDDPTIRALVRAALEREEAYRVLEAREAAEALRMLRDSSVDIVILDIGLPHVSGLELLAQLRAVTPDPYVMLLTSAGSETDRVLGLMSGADDYIVKPFSIRELTARVMAAARRQGASHPTTLRLGDLAIDVAARRASLGGTPLDLTRREFDLLSHLALHVGRTITREQLLEAVWSSSAEWQTATTVTEHVRRLRVKLGADASHPWIVTVRGVGYRFEADDEDVAFG